MRSELRAAASAVLQSTRTLARTVHHATVGIDQGRVRLKVVARMSAYFYGPQSQDDIACSNSDLPYAQAHEQSSIVGSMQGHQQYMQLQPAQWHMQRQDLPALCANCGNSVKSISHYSRVDAKQIST